ncbi:MAG: thioredoxin domain-containing protein [Prolixibacteraceae bacterium]|jgi:protein-disulfide isomerase|nr:thioredoxin domain-containing protein [Prolixibacteraceae bacterium]
MIRNIILIVSLALFLSSCKSNCSNKSGQDDVVAYLNKRPIRINEVDSLINDQIYELRLNAIKPIISKLVLEDEANKQKLTLEQLIKIEINSKIKEITQNDIDKYIIENSLIKCDTNSIVKYLEAIERQKRKFAFTDSLLNNHSLKVKMQPPNYRTINTDGLYYHDITNNKSNVNIYIISDYRCPACQYIHKDITSLFTKYNNSVNFRFVYYSDYIDKSAIACEAAANQNKFNQMYNLIFNYSDYLTNSAIYYDFADSISLDIDKFCTDMNDPHMYNNIMRNKEILIKQNIFATPTFIVNGKVLDGKYASHYLEDVILNELSE